MSRVLFSHSYFLNLDPKQQELGQPYPPLATLIAAALMRSEKQEVFLFDTMFAQNPTDIIPELLKIAPDYFVLYDDGFNYLNKMCLTNMRNAAFQLISFAREKGCKVIVSGSDSTDHRADYLNRGADFVITGEAELTLLELIQALDIGNDFRSIKGLAYKQDDQIVQTSGRPVMRMLDELPFPAWDLVHIPDYKNCWIKHNGYFSINMVTTRGCPYKCNWCAKPIYGNRYNSRTPEHVVQEIMLLKTRFDFDHIWFCDDIFGLKPGWVKLFAEEVAKNNIGIRYKIQSRADLLVQPDYVKALAASGCETVWMGAESGSQKILDAMDKGTTVEQITESTRLLKASHILPSFFIQFGYPGEEKEDLEATIQLINTLLPEDIGISISYPLPGTVFHERVKSELKDKLNWSDSGDLAMLFRGTYSPAFYKQLHRYVHTNYRKHQGYENLLNLFRYPARVNRKTIRRAASLFYYIPVVLLEKRKLARTESYA